MKVYFILIMLFLVAYATKNPVSINAVIFTALIEGILYSIGKIQG